MTETYGEAVYSQLKDRKVEIFLGSNSKSHEYLDYSVNQKEVIRGTLRNAVGDLLVVEVGCGDRTNLAYINIWNVIMIVEPKNGISVIDVYCDAASKQAK